MTLSAPTSVFIPPVQPAEQLPALVMEVTLPAVLIAARTPAVDGWDVRVWPVARLGDATLEARPHSAGQGLDDLRNALSAAGIGILGPIHTRHTN